MTPNATTLPVRHVPPPPAERPVDVFRRIDPQPGLRWPQGAATSLAG